MFISEQYQATWSVVFLEAYYDFRYGDSKGAYCNASLWEML